MRRKRRPPGLWLYLCLRHPASEVRASAGSCGPGEDSGPAVDADGHEVCFEMGPMPGDALAWATLRRAVSPRAAAALLRKLAALLERHGGRLLNLPRGAEGAFDGEGQPEVETFRPAGGGADG